MRQLLTSAPSDDRKTVDESSNTAVDGDSMPPVNETAEADVDDTTITQMALVTRITKATRQQQGIRRRGERELRVDAGEQIFEDEAGRLPERLRGQLFMS
ncbi:hypothetical protein MRX96_001957 [Rhipicephalus microplus]